MTRIVFMGTPQFAVPSLQALLQHGYQMAAVVTQPDRRGGRGRKQLIPPPVKVAALEAGLLVIQTTKVSGSDVVQQLRELGPDVMVMVAFGQLLRPNVLEIPPHGTINVHASLLPKYRGAAPVAAAIIEGDQETGVTIMLVDKGMDTGPILDQCTVPIRPDDTTGTLTERLAHEGADLLIETLPRWLAGEIIPQPQDNSKAVYHGQIHKEDACIDWTEPAERIARLIRAYDPWPGAYTSCAGSPLKIQSARAIPDWSGSAQPGEMVELPEGLAVATGQGALLLDQVQPAGKRAMTCASFACGQRDLARLRLGEP